MKSSVDSVFDTVSLKHGAERLERECGSCTMCCKTHQVDEIQKPKGVTCMACTVGVGCQVYADRPQSCQDFECWWLNGFGPDDWRPDKIKCVFDMEQTDELGKVVRVFESMPSAAERPLVKKILERLCDKGHIVIIIRPEPLSPTMLVHPASPYAPALEKMLRKLGPGQFSIREFK